MAHTVRCAHNWCDEYSVRVEFTPTSPEVAAAQHRRALAEVGWTDREGRDYCPEHGGDA